MRKKLIGVVKSNKEAMGAALTSMAVTLTTLPVFASDETSAINTALESGLNTAVNDFVGLVAIVVPIGLTVFAATFGVKKAIQFFKTISK